MSGDEIKFWDSSDTPSYDDWLRSAESVVGAENVESVLHTTLPNGIRTKPIYTGEMVGDISCLLYTSPSPRDGLLSRMPSSA